MAQLGRSYPNRAIIVRPSGVDVSTGTTLTVTAGITADGIVSGPSLTVVSNRTAIQDAYQHYRGVGKGIPNRPVYTWRSSLADVVGQGTANLVVTDAITAAGTTGQDASLTVTATITADGVVVAGGTTPAPIVSDTALHLASLFARTAGWGIPLPAIISRSSSADPTGAAALNVAVGITADGFVSAAGSPTYVVNTTAIRNASIVYRTGFPNRPVFSRSSLADVLGAGTANLVVTDAITAVGDSKSDPTLTVTAAIVADGIVGLGPSPTYISNDVAVQTAILFYTVQGFPNRPDMARSSLADVIGSGTASLVVTASITAAGVVGTSSGATLTVTASITASQTPAGSAALTVTAGITAAGRVESSASLTGTATITAAGTVAATGQAMLAIVAAIVASPFPPAIPPITVTGSSSPAASVTGSSTPAATVTGSTAPAITVH